MPFIFTATEVQAAAAAGLKHLQLTSLTTTKQTQAASLDVPASASHALAREMRLHMSEVWAHVCRSALIWHVEL